MISKLLNLLLKLFGSREPVTDPIPAPTVDPAHVAPAPAPAITPPLVTKIEPVAPIVTGITPPTTEPIPSQASITTPAGFISAIGPAARTSMVSTKIPASFTVAEAALESGWGAHCPGHNLFGIKADPSWSGPVTMQMTHEVVDGNTQTIVVKFRAYPDWLASIEDHAKFLTTNPRYKPAFATTDGEKFATAVAHAGYATDPQYAAKICSIIEAHHLLALDTEVV